MSISKKIICTRKLFTTLFFVYVYQKMSSSVAKNIYCPVIGCNQRLVCLNMYIMTSFIDDISAFSQIEGGKNISIQGIDCCQQSIMTQLA